MGVMVAAFWGCTGVTGPGVTPGEGDVQRPPGDVVAVSEGPDLLAVAAGTRVVSAPPESETGFVAGYVNDGVAEDGDMFHFEKAASAPIVLELAAPATLVSVGLHAAHTGDGGASPRHVKFEGAPAENGPWRLLAEAEITESTAGKPIPVTAEGVRYVRLTVVDTWGDPAAVHVGEVVAHGTFTEGVATPSVGGGWSWESNARMWLAQDGAQVTGCVEHTAITGVLVGLVLSWEVKDICGILFVV
jgi:hypothetical protein